MDHEVQKRIDAYVEKSLRSLDTQHPSKDYLSSLENTLRVLEQQKDV